MRERGQGKTSQAVARPKARRAAKLAAPGRFERLREFVLHPGFIPAASVGFIFFLMCIAVIGLSRGHLLIAEGRILDESRTVRVEFQVRDEAATERDRAARAFLVPRFYGVNESVMGELESSLRSLPPALAASQTFEEVAPEIQASFKLTAEQYQAVRNAAADERSLGAWDARVAKLMDLLGDYPLLTGEELQLALADPASRLVVRLRSGMERNLSESNALNVMADNTIVLREMASNAGFDAASAPVVVQRILANTKPTFLFDKTETDARRARIADTAPPVMITYRDGEVLARRGEMPRPEQLVLLREEHRRFREALPLRASIAQWIGIIGVAGVIAGAFGVYVRLFYSDIALRPGRFLSLTLLIAAGAGVACWGTIVQPGWLWGAAIAPVVFITMIAVITFEARLGLATAAALCALVGSSLGLSVGYFAVVISAAGAAAWQLKEVRSRNDVVRAAMVVGAALMVSTSAVNLLSRPLVAHGAVLWEEILTDALRAGIGGFFAGAMTLVVLPAVERIFDVTTGMTLSELRDPKQTLLRKLQLQAPGTFNHSHTVATLAEAAAEAIGADGLHVYVGALYHDIGKMNKPDYFVENQPRGFNRHSKLSPAMSLLVIVGHVKDGVELAREYSLPRSLMGYIETHHGTTLVEYFYDQARRAAEEGDADEPPPQEIEYRYPGPKPWTKEQAILMICDAVESATRAMPEPTPSRIQSLVHMLATKRLMDGQFDECQLTLAELSKIEEAVSRTLASIYHGRIAYPSTASAGEGRGPGDTGSTRSPLAEQAG